MVHGWMEIRLRAEIPWADREKHDAQEGAVVYSDASITVMTAEGDMEELIQKVPTIVDLIRGAATEGPNGRAVSIQLIEGIVQAAFFAGEVSAANRVSDMMLATIDQAGAVSANKSAS